MFLSVLQEASDAERAYAGKLAVVRDMQRMRLLPLAVRRQQQESASVCRQRVLRVADRFRQLKHENELSAAAFEEVEHMWPYVEDNVCDAALQATIQDHKQRLALLHRIFSTALSRMHDVLAEPTHDPDDTVIFVQS